MANAGWVPVNNTYTAGRVGPDPGALRRMAQQGQFPTGGSPVLDLAAERQRILDLFQQDQGFFQNDPMGLMGQLQGRASGQQQPFNPLVVQNMLSANAGAGNQAWAGDRDMIRQTMANQGLSGSGAEMAGLLGARRSAQSQIMAGRRDITSRAQLENFAAQERAQQQVQEYLRMRASHEQQARLAEAGFRSQAKREEQQAPRYDLSNIEGPQLTGAGTVFDQGEWERMKQQLAQFLEQQQQPMAAGANPYNTSYQVPSATAKFKNTSYGGLSDLDPAPSSGYGYKQF